MEKAKTAKSPQASTPAATKSSSQPLSHGVGRRKSAVARVWLYRGNGKININGKEFNSYFDTEFSRLDVSKPFRAYPAASHYNVVANVEGGGLNAQADAISLATARALIIMNPEARSVMRKNNLLTCDSRVKERKKYGQKAARRKFQFVKR
jgi:small subunit ribosomal protein S9